MAVTLEELTEFGWEDYLNEEMYEEALENYVEKLTDRMTDIEDSSLTQDMEEKRKVKKQDHGDFRGSSSESSYLCGTEFWKNLSHTCGRKRMNILCAGEYTETAACIYRRNTEKSGS